MLLEDCDVVARNPRVFYAPGTKTFTSSRGIFQESAQKTGLEAFVGRPLASVCPEKSDLADRRGEMRAESDVKTTWVSARR
jgi:hypothetical protein